MTKRKRQETDEPLPLVGTTPVDAGKPSGAPYADPSIAAPGKYMVFAQVGAHGYRANGEEVEFKKYFDVRPCPANNLQNSLEAYQQVASSNAAMWQGIQGFQKKSLAEAEALHLHGVHFDVQAISIEDGCGLTLPNIQPAALPAKTPRRR